ncbi:MAG: pyrroline-5-carboxylate reductase, partial [Spirochaetes bacterium]|nr:pyrroline-5-carboxylate reductase [Spirochaetota bacterium]
KKSNIIVSDKDEDRVKYFRSLGISAGEMKEVSGKAGILFLAVKPDQVREVCETIREGLSDQLIISIAAGVTIAHLEEFIQKNLRIVRVMPNTPALINRGMSVYCYNSLFQKEDKETVESILGAVGRVLFLEEKYFDAVTGLSGSGPAYIFLVINALAEGGVKMGLPEKTAMDLAVQTVLGSAELVQKTGRHPLELKDMVTSPGGTTIEGLKVLEDHKIKDALMLAVEAATIRSKNLMK